MQEYWNSLSGINKVKFVVSMLIGVMAVVFATLNWNSQEVHLIFSKKQMPLTMLIIFSMIGGYAIAYVFSYRKGRDLKKEIDALKMEIEELKEKLN
jgi:uncharacterized integral membrane protein